MRTLLLVQTSLPCDPQDAEPLEDNLFEWHANLWFDEASPLHLIVRFDEHEYPKVPPTIECCTPFPHSNVQRTLRGYTICLDMLDKPEQMLLELASIPRLEGRLRAMMFKAQFETDMNASKAQVAELLRASRDAFDAVEDLFESVDPDDADLEPAGDVIRIAFSNGQVVVLNTQRPARQIWLAGGKRAWHFSYDATGERWLDDKGGAELMETLKTLSRDNGLQL